MDISFLFPAVLILRLQVWRRRKNLAGKSPPSDSDLFDATEFGKNLDGLSSKLAASADRRFEFYEHSELFIGAHDETRCAVARMHQQLRIIRIH